MLEVIWHGRGGQGAFTGAKLLGATASLMPNTHSLAFPTFGPERRGAPICAYTKIDISTIGDRSKIKKADYVVYLDETLFSGDWKKELKTTGRVLINSTHSFEDERIYAIDASGIAKDIIKRDVPNIAFVALIAKLSDTLSLNCAKQAVKEYLPENVIDKNLKVIDAVEAISISTSCEQVSNEPSKSNTNTTQLHKYSRKKQCIIPKLRNENIESKDFSRNTCWEAGWLVTKNSAWATCVPILDSKKCTGCLKCYMDCPDGCIFKPEDENVHVAFDYDFCKGCAVCFDACKFGAIKMMNKRSE